MIRAWLRASVGLGLVCWFGFFVATNAAVAGGHSADWGPYGDGDVFPHSCVNFSGEWRSDDGGTYEINQYKCEYVRISLVGGWSEDGAACVDLVPDNKLREISDGHYFSGITRHRWNSLEYGQMIRTWARYNFEDRVVYEERQYEYVNRDMILLSIYRSTDVYGGSQYDSREAEQRVFRRIR